MQGWIRSVWRFIYFAFSVTASLIGFVWKVILGESKEMAGIRIRRRWLNRIPRRLGVRMQVEGIPHLGPCLYVGNHVTYIDPIAVLMQVDANVVAKAEVSSWPLVGLGAAITGTIFVKREEKNSREEAAQAIRDALQNGISILVFPEGTTSAGPGTLPFRPRSFEAAQSAGVPVQPIAIIYESPEVAYIGDHTFLPHFFRVFRMRYIRGRIAFGPPLYGEDTCSRAKKWIDETQSSYAHKTPIDAFA
jgi:lyso-ornithine lipid O-acyltransferase